jgi:hypothetical protein
VDAFLDYDTEAAFSLVIKAHKQQSLALVFGSL